MSSVASPVPDLAVTRAATSAPVFETDHQASDLTRRTVRGAAITGASQVLRLIMQTGSTMVLARILTPRDFGLVGMVAAVTGFVGLFKDLGLSSATVQRTELTHAQVSTLFWINLGVSAALMALLAAVAPLVSVAYGEPQLTWITLWLSPTLILGGLTAQHHAILRRQMRYRELAVADVVALVASIVVAVMAALAGAGYWALVLGAIAQAAANLMAVWWIAQWLPGRPETKCGVRSMLVFGGNLTAYNTLSYLAMQADSILIGWYWGAGAVGLYSRAYGLLMLPLQQIRNPIGNVAIPALCRLQEQPQELRAFYLKTLSFIALFTLPAAAAVVLGADDIILLLLGPQWRESGAILRALAFALPLQAVLSCIGWLFIATGRTGAMLKWGIYSCGAIIAGFLVGLPFGAFGVAVAYSVATYVVAWPCSAYGVRGTLVTTGDFWGTMVKPLVAALVAGAAAVAARYPATAAGAGTWLSLGISWAVLGIVYAVIMLYVFGLRYQYVSVLAHFRSQQGASTRT